PIAAGCPGRGLGLTAVTGDRRGGAPRDRLFEVGHDLPHRVGGRAARHPAPRMGARAAEVQTLERPAVAVPAQERARDEELVERELAVHRMAAREAMGLLEV